jgi:hypothetical protein
MKKIWILLVIALVVLFVGFREGLEATATIKAPSDNLSQPYPLEEMKALYDRVPQNLRDTYAQERIAQAESIGMAPPSSEIIRMSISGHIGRVIAVVYRELYQPATAPLTDEAIRQKVEGSTTGSAALKAVLVEAVKLYFAAPAAAPTPYQQVLTDMGQTTTPPPAPTGESTLARTRPGPGDTRLRGEVAAYTGLPTNNPMIDTIIGEMARFYDSVYVPGDKRMPTQSDIQSFVMQSTVVPANRKSNLTSAIDYWFTEPAAPGDFRVEGGTPTPPPPPGTTTGPAAGGPMARGFGTANNRIWGPPFSGFGRLRNWGDGGDGSGRYPNLLGPPRERAPYMSGVGVVPPSQSAILPPPGSTGSDPMAAYLPYSRQPGDRELIPDPYRVSQSYSPASHSSKNEPVPFLTDFSAFLK